VWHAGDVVANGIRLHYTRTGGAKPPLLLAHGVTDDGLCWSRVAEALAPRYDVVMLDARGHGRSAAPEQEYSLAAQAADAAGAIAALGLTRPAILGHSLGAAMALVLAGTYPDLPGAILLEDPPAWWTAWSTSPEADERHAAMRARAAEVKTLARDALIADQRANNPDWSDDELETWADAKQRFSPGVLDILDPRFPTEIDWPTLLPRIECPTLLLTGDPSRGAIVTTASAAALRALVPQLEIVHFPEAGHSIHRDQFERFLDAVRAFLAARRANIGEESDCP
jgi:pimeloyl-ACP methyl ester carboxylesterase